MKTFRLIATVSTKKINFILVLAMLQQILSINQMTLQELIEEVINKMESAEIPYMISGSLALSAYILPRMTRDIDIIVELDESGAGNFMELFGQDFFIHLPTVIEEINRKGMFNIIDNRSGYKVDFILRKDTDYRKMEFSRRRRMRIMNKEVWVVSVEDLILSKLIWIQQVQSEKQIDDIRNLLNDTHPDFSYLKMWIDKLNLNTFDLMS